MAILCLATGIADLKARLGAHRRRLSRPTASPVTRRRSARRSARWRRCCATRSSRTWCRPPRACRRSSTAARSRTSRTAPTRSPPRALALALRRRRRHRGRLRLRARRREVLRHQLPLRRLRAERARCWSRRCARSRCTAACRSRASREPDAPALERGLENLEKHVENIRKFEQPCVVAINHFPTDTEEETDVVRRRCAALGVEAVVARPFSEGGAGCVALAEVVRAMALERARIVPAALRLERVDRGEDPDGRARDVRRRGGGLRAARQARPRPAREARLREPAGLHRQDAAVAVGQSRAARPAQGLPRDRARDPARGGRRLRRPDHGRDPAHAGPAARSRSRRGSTSTSAARSSSRA